MRFAPSPTGNLHVGGARTALFNWLYARKLGGTFVLRVRGPRAPALARPAPRLSHRHPPSFRLSALPQVEDTDLERSTRASEEAMMRDLRWLGLDWDEGPDVGGPHAPYRQSERTSVYAAAAQRLVAEGKAYPCFCSEEELEGMRSAAEAAKEAPKYTGRWASASAAEVDAALASGLVPVYRFRVPADRVVTVPDAVRGDVSWNTDAVGDFVLVRSNGQPVYNFCVAVDDAAMGITHVLRAEEHLPNTLRQLLVYEALGATPPTFAHVSLILAPDRSKLSKRHGATSVGEFRAQGFLPAAMNNFLALLGWNDGTAKEIFALPELAQAFSLDRITKSPAVFDGAKLRWMNGQHLRALGPAGAEPLVGGALAAAGLAQAPAGAWPAAVAALLLPSCELVADAPVQLRAVLAYPLGAEAASEAAGPYVAPGGGFAEVAAALLAAAADGGALDAAVAGGPEAWKGLVKRVGAAAGGRKGKALFMPLRLALTGRLHGPDVGEQLALLAASQREGALPAAALAEEGAVVPLERRLHALRAWLDAHKG